MSGFTRALAREASTTPRKRLVFIGTVVCLSAALMAFASTAGAVNTTDDPGWLGTAPATPLGAPTQPCLNGATHASPAENCNIYEGKTDVFLTGMTHSASLPAGTYFFAVVPPGGQADPNDSATDNLSSNAPTADPATNREFSVDSSGAISPLNSTHAFDTNTDVLQVAPYNDTPNAGNVYVLAVCKISDSPNDYRSTVPTVAGSGCKYDAFKVQPTTCDPTMGPCGPQPAADLLITKDAAGADTNTFGWQIAKNVDNTTITNASGSGTFNYTVTVTRDGGKISGVKVTGTIQVFNPNVDGLGNTVPVTGAVVTDQLSSLLNCTVTNGNNATLASFETDFSYSCDLGNTLPSGELDNTATVTWPTQNLVDEAPLQGNSATFTFTNIAFTQTNLDDCVGVSDALVPAGLGSHVCETTTFPSYSSTVQANPGTCTPQANTATYTTDTSGTQMSEGTSVQYCDPADLTVKNTGGTSYTRTYNWNISKSADHGGKVVQAGSSLPVNYSVTASQTGFTDSAIQATGTITVSNPNTFQDIPLTDVTDSVDNGGNCSITSGSPTANVPAGGSVILGYTCTYADGSLPSPGTNTAAATWNGTTAATPDATASDEAAVTFGSPASMVNQTVTPTDAFNGGAATNLCSLDNTGPCTLAASDDATSLTTHTYAYQRTLAGTAGTCTTYGNTAGFVEISPTSPWSVQLCVAEDLGVSKTAAPVFTRGYNWSIKKTVDKTLVDQASGNVTLNYTVVAKELGVTDGGWHVTGNITVSNPNDFESITANISDVVNDGGTCQVTGGMNVNVPASGSVTPTYTCSFITQPAYTQATNTGTATWDQTTANTPHGTASGMANFTFNTGTTGNPTKVNPTVHVTDTFNGALTPTALGTVTATDPPATLASTTYTLAKTLAITVDKCVDYPNTATITETSQTSSVSSKLCGGVAGGLTMGFWQNKNGQAIITGGAVTGTAKVCNSGTWLRTYNPFQETALSATATCAQVATYVTNIIKAANASGAAMNAMLKAQMLATALDVYFSDPALGTNKITALLPLGGVMVDLTKICHMLDNTSTGAGSCGGTFENVSSAFGNPPGSELTITAMLSYASSQANAGGSAWYGQLKTTQGLAKDAFDAINNGAAFAGA
jgi:hypothetical protein